MEWADGLKVKAAAGTAEVLESFIVSTGRRNLLVEKSTCA